MEGNNQHIDQYFRQGLKGYTEQPTPDVWDALEKRLDDDKRRRGFAWWWFALFFLVATGFGVFYFNAPTPAPTVTVPAPTPTPTLTLAPASPVIEQPIIAKPKAQRKRTVVTTPAAIPAIENEITATNITEPTTETTALNIPAKEEPALLKTTEAQKEEPDYSELKPFAGKSDPHVDVPISAEEYYALMPVAGKQATPIEKATSNAVPLAQNTQAAAAITPQAAPVTPGIPAAKQETVAAVTAPTNTIAPAQEPESTQVNKTKKINLSAGLRSGYEFGTKPYHANSFVIAPYFQYYFSKHIGLMLQPALKYSHSPSAVLAYGSHYKVTDSSKVAIPSPLPGGPLGTDERMVYTETYDSVVTSHTLAEIKFWNLDLPIMVCYKVNNKLEIYGGVNMHFTKVPQIRMQTDKYTITRVDTVTLAHAYMSIQYDTPSMNQVFSHNGFSQPYYTGSGVSTYNPNAQKSVSAMTAPAAISPFDNPLTNPFKMGVTFGASYNFRERFQFELLYRQNLSKMDYIPNEKVREIYKQPYLRLTLGYKIFK